MPTDKEDERPLCLVMTVGGSAEPLAKALDELQPERVIFIVSDGENSSKDQVENEEIAYSRDGKKGPGLAHLSSCPRHYDIVEVPPDDPGTILAKIDIRLEEECCKQQRIIADYTGGTKSMTAALVQAATARENVELQFMLGQRPDLRRVKSGTEKPTYIPKILFGFARYFDTTQNFLEMRNYGAALNVITKAYEDLGKYGNEIPKSWRRRIDSWRQFLVILDNWDRFQHQEARKLFQQALERKAKWTKVSSIQSLSKRIETVVKEIGKPSFELVEDLWLNANRRANLGAYDDAIARLYRLYEAVVQARLYKYHKIETGCIDYKKLPCSLKLKFQKKRCPNKKCREKPHKNRCCSLGLNDALIFLKHLDADDELVKAWPERPPKWRTDRNKSILAHGYNPLKSNDWNIAKNWFEERKELLWEAPLGRPTYEQLPNKFPVKA